MLRDRTLSFPYTVAAWVLTGVALVLVLQLHVLPALLAGMLVYQLVHVIAPTMNRHLSDQRAKLIAVGLLSAVVVMLVTVAIVGVIFFFKSDAGSISALLAQMAEIIQSSRATMPNWIVDEIPASPEDLKETLAEWLRTHAADVQLMGKQAGRMVVHTVIGMVLGAMIALHQALPIETNRPLARELVERIKRLGDAFRRVVFAQVQISLINTVLTGIYLAAILPGFGVNLPFKKTLIAVTFITGLLPVVGNLISNVVIVVVSLSYSPRRCHWLVAVSGRDPQARIFPERPHRRQAHRMPRMGAVAGDARDGSGVRHCGCNRRTDLLRIPEGRAGGAGPGVVFPGHRMGL